MATLVGEEVVVEGGEVGVEEDGMNGRFGCGNRP